MTPRIRLYNNKLRPHAINLVLTDLTQNDQLFFLDQSWGGVGS